MKKLTNDATRLEVGFEVEYSTIPRNGRRSRCSKEDCSAYVKLWQLFLDRWKDNTPDREFVESLSDGEWHPLTKELGADVKNFSEWVRLIPNVDYSEYFTEVA